MATAGGSGPTASGHHHTPVVRLPAHLGAAPSASQGSVQPSGSVLTASRAPKVRIKLPRPAGGSSGGGSAAGGSSGGGATPAAEGGEPASKRSKQ